MAAGVATVVSSSSAPALADAPAPVQPRRRILDEWELISAQDGKAVLFSAGDIDNAVGLLTRPTAPTQTAAIEELDTSDCSSDGTVDELIERSSYSLTKTASSGFDASLFTVAARLLKSPGVQKEIISAALQDPEVFDILAGKMDLSAYLGSQGLAARGLLTSTDSAVQEECTGNSEAADEDSSSVLDDLSAWAADRVEGLGFAVVRLGRWMRGKLSGGQQDAKDSTAAASSSGAGQAGGESAFMRRVGGGTLAAVMVAMVAIVAVVLLKKPIMLRRVPKRFG